MEKRTKIIVLCSLIAVVIGVLIILNFVFNVQNGLMLEVFPKIASKGNLIHFEAVNEKSVKECTTAIDDFLEVYKRRESKEIERNCIHCDYRNYPKDGEVCRIDVSYSSFGPCSTENQYGYMKSSPCVFLRLSNVLKFVPQFYNKTGSLPANIPKDLLYYINRHSENDKQHEVVWVSCEGELPIDIENLGPINYIPMRGFPGYFFPLVDEESQVGYLPPIVAINFERPRTGVLINIECKAWSPNLGDNGYLTTNFKLMVD